MELKKFKFVIFLLIILIGLTSCRKQNNNILYNKKYIDEIKQTRNDLRFYLASNSIPGASIAIAKGGEIIYSEGMGLASRDLEVPVTRETKFRIGSCSQIFTALAYQMLVENGTLQPDSSVQYYLPEFPEKKYRITLDNLVNNASGIRPEYSSEAYKPNYNINLQKGLDAFKNDSLINKPGYYQYMSPLNYNLLGAVMEKATNKKFDSLVHELVIDTLHLENTVFDHLFGTVKGRSAFYDHNIVALTINAASIDLRSQAPSKGILSNAEDLVKLSNAFLYSNYIPENVKTKIFSPIILKSGYKTENSNGWDIVSDGFGRTIYSGTGYVTGGGATILIYPKEELVLAIATNTTMDLQEPPVYKIANYFIPKPETKQQAKPEQKTDSLTNRK